MRLIDADKLKQHYAWWDCTEEGKRMKETFDAIIDQQHTIVEVKKEEPAE